MDGRDHYGFILASSLLPFLGVLAAIVLLWNRIVGWSDLIVLAIMYSIAILGISAGYHRLLTHRSFKTSRPMKIFLATAGTIAGQGPALIWCSHHRRHHRVADKPGDPHSPYLDDEPGIRGALKGLWHSHLGWLFDKELTSDPIRYCPDLARDKDIRFISTHFIEIVIAGIVLPGLLGLAITQTWQGFLTGALWGGLVRIFLANHVTYAVNSIGHYYGRRRFDTPDESRNVAWLSIPSFGEAWHNNHHAFPKAAFHGFRWWEVDLTAVFIWVCEKLGLVWDVVRIPQERIAARAAGLSQVGGGRTAAAAPPKPLAERPDHHGAADVE
ncbi:acyl-CoA desaturase [Nocardia sp. CDC159]|uniref:Acyl-CoA desaturase n=1 Tax=Nocardia pulmonis TaxID=2951408 RepID=A0A9X2EDR6_9NOCA|nr:MULTISPECIES: acyl-CoA desaturase [Nocardia]MCM6779024.1 acyl-CoA desaturase [Nocardia pulmonis]MCM6791914.1 acyl-CoA desaturase [Nocardia sp. CDC159]